MNIEEVINLLNRKFIFKTFAFLALSFPTFQYYGQLQNILLALVVPNFICVENSSPTSSPSSLTVKPTISNDQCKIVVNYNETKPCTNWTFSLEPVGVTLSSEFKLICDNKQYQNFILIFWYVTSFLSPIMGTLADKFGRKKLVIFNLILETISSIGLAFSPNLTANIFFRVLQGISASGVFISYVWLLEIVDSNFRNFIGSFFWLFGCIAYMVFPLIVYLTKDWRATQLYSLIPSVLYILILFIPESPRWLFVIGNRKLAKKSLMQIAKINGIKDHISIEQLDITDEVDKDEQMSVCFALKSSDLVKRVTISFLLMFSTYLFYSAVTVNLNILSNNVFLSMFILGLMETPGLFLSYVILKYVRRKRSTLFLSGLGSSLFLLSVFFSRSIQWQSIIRIVIGCIAKTAIASVNQTTMVYLAEMFPTSFRSLSMLIIQIANFLSFVSAIYVNKLEKYYFYLPMLIYFILIWISCIIVMFTLPETKDLPIPETLTDLKMLKVGNETKYLAYMKMKDHEIKSFVKDSDDLKESDMEENRFDNFEEFSDTEYNLKSSLSSNESNSLLSKRNK